MYRHPGNLFLKTLVVTFILFEPEQNTMLKSRIEFSDQQGNESMQTVLTMAVGALILIAVNHLYREVSPTIRQYVQSVVSGQQFHVESGTGRFSFGTSSPSQTAGSPSTVAPIIEIEQRKEFPNEVQPAIDERGSRQTDLRRAEAMVTEAMRLDRLAELAHLAIDTENESRLRAESEKLKLEAAKIRDGARGESNTQKQIDAANAMRSLLDIADNGSGLLPTSIDKFYQWAKIPVRDGLPQITEVTIEFEQKFHQWLAEQAYKK